MFRYLEPSQHENLVLKSFRTKLGVKREQVAPFLTVADNYPRADAVLVYEQAFQREMDKIYHD